MSSANVQSSDAIIEVRATLIQFAERAQAALASLRQEARATLRWLQDEQPQYWQQELRRGYDRVASARASYETCRLRTVAGHRSACIEEKVALQRAQRRLEYVQQQIVETQRWGQRAAEQANEFFSRLGPLEHSLDEDVPQLLAVLQQMVLAIEAYNSSSVATAPEATPTTSPLNFAPSSSLETSSETGRKDSQP